MVNIYFRPHDKDGHLKIRPKGGKQVSYREQFFAHWLRYDIPRWRVQLLWEEQQRKEQEEKQLRLAKSREKKKEGSNGRPQRNRSR